MQKKRKIILWVTVLLVMMTTTAFAEIDLNANGYDWLNLSIEEKYELIDKIYTILKLDKNKYSIEKSVKTLNGMYLNTMITATVSDMDITLNASCIRAVEIGIDSYADEFKRRP